LPDSARAAFDEADRLAAAGRFEEAAAAYEKILVQHPNSVVVLANLGVVRMHQQQHDAALELLKRCIALAPDDAFSHSMLGLCHYFRKEYDDALAALSRAIALNPQDALSYNYRGTTCGQKGWYEAAENDLRKAIELQPTFGDAHRNLANIYMKQRPASPRLAHFHYLKSLEFGVKPDAELQRLIEEKIGVHTGHGAPAPTQP
jgi:tetratricopeptide (TPR) repeat protein